MTSISREGVERILADMGVTHSVDRGGWKTFMEITHFLDSFSGEEKRTYCQWIQEYLEKTITPEEQEKINNGEWRVDDV